MASISSGTDTLTERLRVRVNLAARQGRGRDWSRLHRLLDEVDTIRPSIRAIR